MGSQVPEGEIQIRELRIANGQSLQYFIRTKALIQR